jgi:tetratricopeptide (TPR) repeat protein
MKPKSLSALLLIAASFSAIAEDTTHCFSAIYSLNEGRLDEAIRLYTRCIDEGDLSNKNLIVAHNDRGNAFGKSGEYQKALADFEKVIELKPDDPDAWYNHGLTLKRLGRIDDALENYNETIRLNPKYAKAYNNRGAIYGEKGQFASAISEFNQAIFLNGKDASAYFNRGLAYYSMGNYGKAIEDLERAIELNPDYIKAYENLAWLRATCPDSNLRDGIMAVALAKKARFLVPDGTPTLYDIFAAAYAEQGSHEKAVQYQQLAIDTAKRDTQRSTFQRRLDTYRTGGTWSDHGGNRFLSSS